MNEWSAGDSGREAVPMESRPDVDTETLGVLRRLDLDPGTISAVKAFLAPARDGTKAWSSNVVPWLPGYHIVRMLRDWQRAAEKRPRMYFGNSPEERREAVDARFEELRAILMALGQRERAGDAHMDGIGSAVSEQARWLQTVDPGDPDPLSAKRMLVLGGLEPVRKRPSRFVIDDEPNPPD